MKIEENLWAIHQDPEDLLETAQIESGFQQIFGAGRYLIVCTIDHSGKSARMDIYNCWTNLEDHADEFLDRFGASFMSQFVEWQVALQAQPQIDLDSYGLSEDFDIDS